MQCGILVWSALEVNEDSPDTSIIRSGLSQAALAWIPFKMVPITPKEILAEQLGTLDVNFIIF